MLEYFGAMTELRNNLRRESIPDKPAALVYTQQIMDTGHLLFEGGLIDQPHIFMKEFKICRDLIQLFEAQERAQRKKE